MLSESINVRRRITWWSWAVLTIVIFAILQVYNPELRVFPNLASEISPWTFLFVFLVALFCEYIDSSLGMGYGTTLTPLLLIAGFSPLEIVPCILLSELLAGALAGVMHHRDGNVNFIHEKRARHTALGLSALSVIGALVAVTVALTVPEVWLTAIITVIILSVGITLLVQSGKTLPFKKNRLVFFGTLAAFNKGISGGGYGPLVTSGQVMSGMPPKNAVAITSVAEAVTCFVGLSAYLIAGNQLALYIAVPMVLGAVCAVPMASLTVCKVPEGFMRASVGIGTTCIALLSLAKLLSS